MEQVSGGINPSSSTVGLRFPLGEPVKEVRDYGNIKLIRGLIWVYFFLLIFEGFLRMVLPAFANALLVVRDPFLLVAYVVALVSHVFPWNKFVVMFWLLGAIALVVGLGQNPGSPLVTFFGFRAAFLHVPLIFIVQTVMDERDVVTMGKWFLILSIPMAILMAAQFNLGGDHWLNRGLDKQFEQIDSAAGHIRPPGTFTYSLGPSMFFSYVTVFLMIAQFQRASYNKALVALSAAASCLALAVSGSRSALAMSGIVILTAILTVVITRPRSVGGLVKFLAVIAIGLIFASQVSIFSEGVDVFSERITNAGTHEGGFIGFLERAFGEFIAGFDAAKNAELTGAGLGVGSNAGAALLSAKGRFLLAEGEWAKMVLEIGPIMGMLYLGMRLGLSTWMLGKSFLLARQGELLPILLFGCAAVNIISGQWGQTTGLGFTILGAGLCLASMNKQQKNSQVGTIR